MTVASSNAESGCTDAGAPASPQPTSAGQYRKKLMKMVVAIIQPFKLDGVRDALTNIGVHGLTVTEVKGYGRQAGHTEIYRGQEYHVNFVPKLRLEVAVPADQTEKVAETIMATAKTGQIGDGKIFVFDLQQAIRIRTGESGQVAL
jgi:nitrogen regulatory protein P-II 2